MIDASFKGFAGLMGSELPATVNARCYTGAGSFTASLTDCISTSSPERSRKHGTAVTEAVFDIAPQADYYIANLGSYSDLLNTVRWMASQGVDVINMSLGWTFDGPGDGTTRYSNAPLKSVDAAVTGGIIWVNAAGNAARDSWYGAFEDSDSDGIHQFNASENECNGVTIDLDPLEGFTAQLRWADSWGGASKNLDLYLIPVSGSTLPLSDAVATSKNNQVGGGNDTPYEWISIDHGEITDGEYCLAVTKARGAAPSWIQLLVWGASGDLQDHVTARSIGNPAESRNSGMLAAGAARVSDTNTIESFSSRGPTTDNRTKPDIVGADGGTSSTYGTWYGTSQASPHVAGLAALVKQRFPTKSPSGIASYLKTNALARGTVPNNTWGYGFARLPALPTPVPLSTDATLSGLTLSDVDFGTFSSDTESYTASVAYSVSQTTVTPTVNDSGADYFIKLDGVTDADGTVSLAVSENVITVEVKAEDGDTTTKTYTVTVTRAAARLDGRDPERPHSQRHRHRHIRIWHRDIHGIGRQHCVSDDGYSHFERFRGEIRHQARRGGGRRPYSLAGRRRERHHRGGHGRGRHHDQDLHRHGHACRAPLDGRDAKGADAQRRRLRNIRLGHRVLYRQRCLQRIADDGHPHCERFRGEIRHQDRRRDGC